MISQLVVILALATGAPARPRRDSAHVRAPFASVRYVGVNIAGFDFGCSTQGVCEPSKAVPPLTSLGGPDGLGQMQHFVTDDNFNMFRLPVGWQYLVDRPGAALNPISLGSYDQLVQGCLATGATCVIDIHNYARWNKQIIGQGGPTNEQFASLWTQLANKYASQTKVAFGVMNEPHDTDINKWADTLQAAVTAIRVAGATSQMIILPGNDWTSAAAMPTKSGPALLKIKNPNGTIDGLIIDVHKYLDQDNSGTHIQCVTNNIVDAFQPLAKWLRDNKRQALNSETGGGNTASCQKYLCEQIAFLNNNSDVFLGYTGWSAGSFDPKSYELSEVPIKNGSTWNDASLVKSCMTRST